MMKLPPGIHLIELETVGSTNDYAKNAAKNGYPSGTLIWSHEQTAGRGRHGNQWVSGSGNLFMSLILRPNKNAAVVGQLSFVIAVALAKTVEHFISPQNKVQLKWPNDLIINDKKAGGILLETELNGVAPVNWVVIGVGVNIKNAPDDALFLNELSDTSIETSLFLELFISKIMYYESIWEKNKFDKIHEEYTSRSYNIKKIISVRTSKETISGLYEGIDKTGALIITLENGSKRLITSGEVFF